MKRLWIIVLALVWSVGSLQAVDMKLKKGQRYYLKNCKECHGKGNRGGNLASMEEWGEYFKDGGAILVGFHKDDPKALAYIQGSKFKKHSKSLLPFLREFANDSPNIPSCNN